MGRMVDACGCEYIVPSYMVNLFKELDQKIEAMSQTDEHSEIYKGLVEEWNEIFMEYLA
jgi:hypothetical protein